MVAIEYSRGAVTDTMQAQIGRTVYDEIDDDGIITRFESRDFLIAIAEFTTVSGPPAIGDVIAETQDSITYQYRVTAITGGQHYQRDAHRFRFRIHTKRISAE